MRVLDRKFGTGAPPDRRRDISVLLASQAAYEASLGF